MTKLRLISFALLLLFGITAGNVASGQKQDSVRYNQYGVAVKRTPLNAEIRSGTLVFETEDESTRIWTDIRVQADGAAFFGETLNPVGNGTGIRRARIGVKTSFAKNWYGEIDIDLANSELELKDAYVKYSFDNGLRFRAGNFKEALSMEATTTSRYLTFMERANVVSTFAPSRHMGVTGAFSRDWFCAEGGVFFQTIGGLEERTFSEDANKDLGVDEGMSYTGRIVIMPLYKNNDMGLHLGLAGSYRTPKTDAEIAGSVRYSTRSISSINRKKYMDTDDITEVDHELLGGLELAGYYKGIRFQGEYIMNNTYRKNSLGTEKFNGFYVFGSYLLFGGKYVYNIEEGEFTQPGRGKDWGDVELALRYDYLDLNSRAEGVMGGSGDSYTLGLNYLVNENVKIMLNYALINHDRYANAKGKLYVGHDIDGNPTKNPQEVIDAAGDAGEDYSMLSIRFEVDF